MKGIITSRFIENKGYWFNIQEIDGEFMVVNTKRKRMFNNRDGHPETLKYFDTLEQAKEYLNNL